MSFVKQCSKFPDVICQFFERLFVNWKPCSCDVINNFFSYFLKHCWPSNFLIHWMSDPYSFKSLHINAAMRVHSCSFWFSICRTQKYLHGFFVTWNISISSEVKIWWGTGSFNSKISLNQHDASQLYEVLIMRTYCCTSELRLFHSSGRSDKCSKPFAGKTR